MKKHTPLVFMFAQSAEVKVFSVNRVFVFQSSISAMVRWTALLEKMKLVVKVI